MPAELRIRGATYRRYLRRQPPPPWMLLALVLLVAYSNR